MMLAVLSLSLCATAAAAGPAPAAPIARAATLTAADFPDGATAIAQNATKSSFLPRLASSSASTSSFTNVTYGGTQLVALISAVEVAESTAAAAAAIAAIAAEVRSTAGRQRLVDVFKEGLANGGVTQGARTTVIRHRAIHVGDLTVDLDFAVADRGSTIDIGVMFIQDGPAVESLVYVASAPGLRAGGSFSLAKLAVARINDASETPPKDTGVPTIAGSLQLGQILNAQPGTWTGSKLSYAYQWFRCNAAGGACVAIAGSSQQTYTVSTADEGATLAISVVATNPSGTTIAMSQSTALIP
jgi:hypothetical protein